MEEYENMDQLFREKLWNIEETPPPRVWNKIELQLGHVKKNQGMALFLKIAAGFFLFISLGVGYYLLQHNNTSTVVSESRTSGKETTTKNSEKIPGKKSVQLNKLKIPAKTGNRKMAIIPQKKPINNNLTHKSQEHKLLSRTEKQAESSEIKIDSLSANTVAREKLGTRNAKVANIRVDVLPDKIIFPTSSSQINYKKITMADEFTENIPIPESQSNPYKEWIVGGQVAPLYAYRDISAKNLPSDATGKINNAEEGILSYAGGLNVKYAANRRLSFQSGIYYTKLGQTIHAPIADNSINDIPSSSFTNKLATQSLTQSSFNVNETYTVKAGSNNIPNSTISAKHYYEYLEVPFILRYKVVDRKIDFDVLGGISTNFLLGNNLQIDPNIDVSNYLVPVENKLTRINYSSSVGLGIEYPVSSRIIINLEPIFKYYLNSINENSNINKYPYTFGIYTGMSYVF